MTASSDWDMARLRAVAEDAVREEAPLPAVGKFRLLRKLGRGAMGVVFEAEDGELKRPVAIKFLHDSLRENDSAYRRFQREAQSAARLAHPNVVQVYGAGEEGDRAWLVMELVRGRPLSEILRDRSFELRPMIELLAKTADGVGAVHDAGMVHRDIKPANILVTEAGEPKVGDFGLAHWIESDASLTRSGTPLGTPMYMSPEQVRGETGRISPATDVFALGAILYEILTGRTPHAGGSTGEVYSKVIGDDPAAPRRLNPAVGADLETICLKALEKDPGRRYPTGTAFAAELRRYLRGEAILARPASVAGRWWRKASKHRAAVFSAGVLLVAAAVTGWGLRRGADRDAAQREALAMLEKARPALDAAHRLRYDGRSEAGEMRRKIEEARPLIEQAVARAPDLPMGRYLLGRAWEALGWEDRAEVEWREALRLDPAYGAARFHLARLRVHQTFSELIMSHNREPEGARKLAREAVAEIRAAMAVGSGFDEDLQRKSAEAMLAMTQGDPAGARAICDEGIAAHGRAEGTEAFHWLTGFLLPGPEGFESFNRALEICPKDAWALFGRSGLRDQRGERDLAGADLDEALRVNPRFAVALLTRGNRRQAAGDLAGAIADFTTFIEVRPAAHSGPFNRGNARSMAGDLAGAIADYGEAIRLNPGWGAPLLYRGGLHEARRDYAAAVEDFSTVLRLAPGWAEAYLGRGRCRMASGDPAGAEADFLKCLEVAPPDHATRPEADRRLREAREAQGKPREF